MRWKSRRTGRTTCQWKWGNRLRRRTSPMIHFSCPNCKQSLKVDNAGIGKRVTCPCCKAPVTVPVSLGSLVRVEEAWPEELPETANPFASPPVAYAPIPASEHANLPVEYAPGEDLEEEWEREV